MARMCPCGCGRKVRVLNGTGADNLKTCMGLDAMYAGLWDFAQRNPVTPAQRDELSLLAERARTFLAWSLADVHGDVKASGPLGQADLHNAIAKLEADTGRLLRDLKG